VLEHVIKNRIERLKIPQFEELGERERTLGALLGFAMRPELRRHNIIPLEAWNEIESVNKWGSKAAHCEPLLEENAWDCLASARHALVCILK
jgi:hypothetical protein